MAQFLLESNRRFYVHRLRHPAALYRLSLEKIADAFCPVAEEYILENDNLRHDPKASLDMAQLLKY
jgi:hypothetical protein